MMRLTDYERRVIAQYERELAHGRGLGGHRLRVRTWLLQRRRWTPGTAAGYLAAALLVILPPWSPAALVFIAAAAITGHSIWWAARRLLRRHRRHDRDRR